MKRTAKPITGWGFLIHNGSGSTGCLSSAFALTRRDLLKRHPHLKDAKHGTICKVKMTSLDHSPYVRPSAAPAASRLKPVQCKHGVMLSDPCCWCDYESENERHPPPATSNESPTKTEEGK